MAIRDPRAQGQIDVSSPTSADLTGLLNRMLRGDQEAGDRAMAELYGSLRRVASARLRRERQDHVLDTGSLVNEAMLRLFGTKAVSVHNRQHFVALICLLMKRVLIDFGRRKDPVFACLEESMGLVDAPDREHLLTIERVLERFAQLDPNGYKVFQLKIGAGMTAEEVAESLTCSVGTVNRRLKRARTWMFKELRTALLL